MFIVTSTAKTASAAKYLQQLCKHFAHKVPAEWDAASGKVSFPFGLCFLEASQMCLRIRCEADDAQKIDRMKHVLDDHLERFAWREKLKLEWCEAKGPDKG